MPDLNLNLIPESTRPIIHIKNAHDFYQLNEAYQQFTYNGRTYTTSFAGHNTGTHTDRYMTATEIENNSCWARFFGGFGKVRRESHISQFLVHPEERQFLVDIDKSLLYRQDTETYPHNYGFPAHVNVQDRTNFTHAVLWRKNQPVNVLINNKMLEFLSKQKELGADICIASSGGWQDSYPPIDVARGINPAAALTIRDFLKSSHLPENRQCAISDFDNGKTLKAKLKAEDKWYWFGSFSKYRKYGDSAHKIIDGEHRSLKTIMIEDQVHQRLGFRRSINPVEFGTGYTWRSFFCMNVAKVADFFVGETFFNRLFSAGFRKHP